MKHHCIDFLHRCNAQKYNICPFAFSDYSTQQLSANDGPADPFGPSNGGSGGTGVGGGGGGYEDVMSKGSSEGGYSNPSLYTNSAPRSSSGDLSFITALLGDYFRDFNCNLEKCNTFVHLLTQYEMLFQLSSF